MGRELVDQVVKTTLFVKKQLILKAINEAKTE